MARIVELTIRHYNDRAETFWQGTRDHDVSQNIAALLRHIDGSAPFTILDLGCGPGRDLMTFAGLGHLAVGVEGVANLAAMARANSGCEIWRRYLTAAGFLELDHYYRPTGLPREQQPWLASVWRRSIVLPTRLR